jgi:hypothetical protein
MTNETHYKKKKKKKKKKKTKKKKKKKKINHTPDIKEQKSHFS